MSFGRARIAIVVLLALVAVAPAAAARRCAKLCRGPIATCRASCSQPERRARRACRATCRRSLFTFCRDESTCTLPERAGSRWVSAYYTGYDQDLVPPSEIDFASLTHLIHFAAIPLPDGGIDTDGNVLSVEHSAAAVAAGHAAGRKVLVSLGGADTGPAFRAAFAAAHRDAFVANVMALVTERGYDGLDVDMEPIEARDADDYVAFVRDVRARLAAAGLLLTAAFQPDARDVALRLADALDQINVMTYDLSGPFDGWVTWHEAPLFDGGLRFDSTGELVPSADAIVRDFIAAGVPASRLGIGAISHAAVWHGASGPGQSIEGVSLEPDVSYRDMLSTLFTDDRVRYDDGAAAAYLSVDLPGTESDLFVSYEDEATCARKMDYVRANGLGGIILWDVAGGYLPDRAAGARNPLLTALGR